MAKLPKAKTETVEIENLHTGTMEVFVLGTSPLIMNRMPKKAWEQLLLPSRSTNKAGREATLKHDPPAEFRDAIYRCRNQNAPTLVHFPNNAFKKAMSQSAVRIPGATKAEIGCLVKVLDETVHIYGKPFLNMMIVRMANINRTPDVRTRAFFPKWACHFTIQYISSLVREKDIVALISSAGLINGIGDGRTEKGTFDFGAWELCERNDPRFKAVVQSGGRKVQLAAMETPECSDDVSEEMLAWYESELVKREREPKSSAKVAKAPVSAVIAAKTRGRGKGNGKHA